MTGGWGTPPGKPILESIKETADRLRERSKEQPAGPLSGGAGARPGTYENEYDTTEENTDDR